MPTVLSHPAPALALAIALGRARISLPLAAAGIFCAVAPDFDVLGFRFGISYAAALGHRGATHSLLFCLGAGLFFALIAPWLKSGRLTAFVVTFFCALSHILLDAMTTGGLGVAVFWPFDADRYFLPWRPIRVSPLSIEAFMGGRGAAVLLSEFYWVWVPCMLTALGGMCFRAVLLWVRRPAGRRRAAARARS